MINVAMNSDSFGNEPEVQLSDPLTKLIYSIPEQNTIHNIEGWAPQ